MEIRQSYDRLISTMGFPLPVRWHLNIESGPSLIGILSSTREFQCRQANCKIWHCQNTLSVHVIIYHEMILWHIFIHLFMLLNFHVEWICLTHRFSFDLGLNSDWPLAIAYRFTWYGVMLLKHTIHNMPASMKQKGHHRKGHYSKGHYMKGRHMKGLCRKSQERSSQERSLQ